MSLLHPALRTQPQPQNLGRLFPITLVAMLGQPLLCLASPGRLWGWPMSELESGLWLLACFWGSLAGRQQRHQKLLDTAAHLGAWKTLLKEGSELLSYTGPSSAARLERPPVGLHTGDNNYEDYLSLVTFWWIFKAQNFLYILANFPYHLLLHG